MYEALEVRFLGFLYFYQARQEDIIMHSFKLSAENFERAKWKMALPGVILAVIIIYLVTSVSVENIVSLGNDLGVQNSAVLLLLTVLIGTVPFIIGIKIYIKKQRIRWLSFEIEIDSTRIIRKQEDNPTIEILREQITGIRESIGYGITVMTGDRNRMIFIPESIEQYAKLKELLSSWVHIDVHYPKFKSNTLTVQYVNRDVERKNYLKKSLRGIIVPMIMMLVFFGGLLLMLFLWDK